MECDLADWSDRRWRDIIADVEAVVHFAYRSPFQHDTWDEANVSVYASHKWAGERLCRMLGKRAGGQTTCACIRIGWCQPGDNLPATLSGTGSHFGDPSTTASNETDRWFKEMWLSNRDFCQLFQRAVEADGAHWPDGAILVHGMSNNAGMTSNLDATRQYLGYEPQDDVYAG